MIRLERHHVRRHEPVQIDAAVAHAGSASHIRSVAGGRIRQQDPRRETGGADGAAQPRVPADAVVGFEEDVLEAVAAAQIDVCGEERRHVAAVDQRT